VTPPPSLVPAVMRRLAEPRRRTFWGWLHTPWRLEMRLSPLAALAGAGVVAAMVIAFRPPQRPAQTGLALTAPAEVVVRFTLAAQGARKVAVAGDFNGWDPDKTVLVDRDGGGTFAASVRLPPGQHEYMFVVDGQWVTDPLATERRPDGFGRDNALLRL
jgi:hypothetical protein